MVKVSAKGKTLNGIDVSHYDAAINWAAVKASGRVFTFIKATEGTGFVDKKFAVNWREARNVGLVCGAYHFFHPAKDPLAQADHFCKTVGKLGAGDLPLVMDWETTNDLPSKVDRARGRAFLEAIESMSGKRPIVYGSPYFLQALELDAWFGRFPLWVAHYGTKSPLIPPPWVDWAFFQYYDKGSVPGIPADNEDLNLFNGGIDELMKLTRG